MIDVQACNTSSMCAPSISAADICVLLREATAAARRLARRLGLPNHEHEDLRQDLLVDVLVRLKWFNPDRGSLGVFAGTVNRHRAAGLANEICHERAIIAPARDQSRDKAWECDSGTGDADPLFLGQLPD